MPLFFFDSADGRVFHEDDVGIEFEDNEAARVEAMRALADLAREYLPSFGPGEKLEMTIRDEHGRSILHLQVDLTVTPLH